LLSIKKRKQYWPQIFERYVFILKTNAQRRFPVWEAPRILRPEEWGILAHLFTSWRRTDRK